MPPRAARLPDWPRLMNETLAAAYLGIGATQLRVHGPAPRRDPCRLGRRVLWHRDDLDRWADALGGQPLDGTDAQSHSSDVERRWLERRQQDGQDKR
jgi:hypothetical protein